MLCLLASRGYFARSYLMDHFNNTSPKRPDIDTIVAGRRMRNHTMRYRVHLVVAALLLVSIVLGFSPANAQEDVEDARKQREQARIEQLEAQAALDVLDAEFEDVQAAFDAADELVRLAENRANEVTAQLDQAQILLRQTEVGIAWAEYDQDQIRDELADLAIRQYLGVSDETPTFGGENLNETLTRNAVLDVVQGAGQDVLDTARSAEDQQQDLRDQAADALAEVRRLEAQLKEERIELDAAREVRERAKDALDGRRQEWVGKIDELEAEEQELTDFIRVETQRLDATSALDAARSGEGYTWPTAGGIASYFGYRVHPILGYSRLHGGLDIGGRMGQPIWAAKEGVVIMARVNGGYGNTIVVDHGGGYATLYGHQSSFEVREGDYVETGQHIGNVGSTGLSTGPHLHFEVRLNGSVIDPLPFLPPR